MAQKYLNYVLAQQASPSAMSETPFVAVGSEMVSIWRTIVLRLLFGQGAAANDHPSCTWFLFDQDICC